MYGSLWTFQCTTHSLSLTLFFSFTLKATNFIQTEPSGHTHTQAHVDELWADQILLEPVGPGIPLPLPSPLPRNTFAYVGQ